MEEVEEEVEEMVEVVVVQEEEVEEVLRVKLVYCSGEMRRRVMMVLLFTSTVILRVISDRIYGHHMRGQLGRKTSK